MRRGLKPLAVAVAVSAVALAHAQQGAKGDIAALQAELARLKEQVARLEAQLQAAQQQRKDADRVLARLSPLSIGGWIQMRYERDSSLPRDATDLARGRARETFRLRRMRLDVRGQPLAGVLYRLQVDAANTAVQLTDAYLTLKAGEGSVTFGHFKTPLLEEALESSAVRWTPERARVSEALFPNGGRDRGIAYSLQRHNLQVDVGLFSGTRATETQDSLTTRKSWLARVTLFAGKTARFWLGRMDGVGRRNFGTAQNPQVLTFDRDRTVLGVLWTPTPAWTLRAEWVDGKDASNAAATPTARVRGWYALLGYKFPHQPITLYAKRDLYDPDRAIAGNTFTRSALGVQYDLNKATRLNLTWERFADPTARAPQRPAGTLWTFQTQVRF